MSFHMSSTHLNAEFSAPLHIPEHPFFFIISGSSLKFANSLTIRSLISSIDAGGSKYVSFHKTPKKTSHSVKSSWGHSVGWSRAITRS